MRVLQDNGSRVFVYAAWGLASIFIAGCAQMTAFTEKPLSDAEKTEICQRTGSVECVRHDIEQYFVSKGDAAARFAWSEERWNRGTDEDRREALRYLYEAATQGDATAQHLLGHVYGFGVGVGKNLREQVRWWRMSAERGDAEAQLHMGTAYSSGAGVVKNLREAVRWWHRAANQGNAWAQLLLSSAYYNGMGVISDLREAYIWYSIAKTSGEQAVVDFYKNVNWHRIMSGHELSAARQEAARRLEAIEQRKVAGSRDAVVATDVDHQPPTETESVATEVFEAAWRSMVVVRSADAQGSGVVIRPNLVATNCHVVDKGGKILVYKAENRRANTNSPYPASIYRADVKRDFCLLSVEGLWGIPVSVRKFDTIVVGEDVYALGAPLGLDLSLSSGVVSQLRSGKASRYIQTDVAISPGSSGGGLFDRKGNLIGITTIKITGGSAEGLSFAIPADLVLGH